MFESIFTAQASDAAVSLAGLGAALGTALALGLLISLVCLKIQGGQGVSRSFALTLVLLPAIVTVIILLVGNNVARAFSLAGAFTIIRFRSAPGNPKDIAFVLFSMAVGLAAGMGFLLYAAIVGVVLCAAAALLELSGYARPKAGAKQLKITVPEDLNFSEAFEGVFEKYTLSHSMVRVKTADLGSVYQLNYAVVLREGISEKAFIDELRVYNGNLNIALLMDTSSTPSAAEF
ncbi:MAG: DUF4956 domain-containing protein [Christensenellaceae bacterium]|jgi:hypothetical protein|nr:DUF4956 domain-containing protein [Christensenellaceae bacterium]